MCSDIVIVYCISLCVCSSILGLGLVTGNKRDAADGAVFDEDDDDDTDEEEEDWRRRIMIMNTVNTPTFNHSLKDN